uniref:Uncharacterized protein n=1 Tax=Sphaerodactylus townsendi TaxID=933632 RepID=A0ACB8EM33_9SAUR
MRKTSNAEEKPFCHEGSLLGMWIGDDAIPCTPRIAKGRSRTKVNNTRGLRLKNKEEELMKLAKQFDKNLTEATQEQDAPYHDCTRLPSDAKVSLECQGDAQMKRLGRRPQMDAALPFGVVKENAETAEHCEHNSQKLVDLDAEVALNALFDCSPQKFSGELSQGSSNSSFHDSQNAKELTSKETAGRSHGSVTAGVPQRYSSAPALNCRGPVTGEKAKKVLVQTIQSAAIPTTDTAVSSNIVSDDLEDWGTDLLSDDSFVMQITQNPELMGPPQKASPSTFQDSCKPMGKTIHLDRPNSPGCAFLKSRSDVAASLALQKQSHELGVPKSVLPQGDFRSENNISSISKSGQNTTSLGNSVPVKPENKSVTEGFTQLKGVSVPAKKAAPVAVHPNLPKPLVGKSRSSTSSIYSDTFTAFTSSKPNNQQEVAGQTSSDPCQTGSSKKPPPSCGDWNEPRLSEEVLDLFCESDSLWGANCEDDDLLYRVCDHVEKSTLSQDVAKENVKATLAVVSAAKPEVNPSLLGLKPGLASCPQPQKSRKTFSLHAPLTAVALLKNENSADPYIQRSCASFKNKSANSHSGKLCRSNLVSDKTGASGMDSIPMSDISLNTNNTSWQNAPWNVGRTQSIGSCSPASNEKSKYAFKKTGSSQALMLGRNSITGGSLGGGPLALGESKNGPNILPHTAVQADPKTAFKRHFSDSSAHSETV